MWLSPPDPRALRLQVRLIKSAYLPAEWLQKSSSHTAFRCKIRGRLCSVILITFCEGLTRVWPLLLNSFHEYFSHFALFQERLAENRLCDLFFRKSNLQRTFQNKKIDFWTLFIKSPHFNNCMWIIEKNVGGKVQLCLHKALVEALKWWAQMTGSEWVTFRYHLNVSDQPMGMVPLLLTVSQNIMISQGLRSVWYFTTVLRSMGHC